MARNASNHAMKHFIPSILTVVMLPGLQLTAQPASRSDPIRVLLPPSIEPHSCRLEYYLVGSFGGYGGFAHPKHDASEFKIETVHEGVGVERLKAALYCRGYQLQTMIFDSVRQVGFRNLQLNPKPLGTVRLSGLVRGLSPQDAAVLDVDVDYLPEWICEFFGRPDCLLGWWKLASVKMDANGRFSATVPDFARDAAISAFKRPGEFTFRIRDQKTGNRLFELKPPGNRHWSLPVANDYPGVLTLDAESAK